MTNYKIKIQYDGTRYDGWQRLGPEMNSIQGKIEGVLSRLYDHKVEIHGSGRTDSGVHALGQIAHFKVNSDKTQQEILSYLNTYLPEDIAVTEISEVSDRFHSRLCAKGKVYCYRILNSEVADVFNRRYVCRIPETLNVEKMREAAKYFIGEHNFKAFCANRHLKKSAIREIYSIDIKTVGEEIQLIYKGSGFLYKMVRIMTGTLIEVGLGEREPDEIPDIIASENRERAGKTALAKGLTLVEVLY